MLLHLFGTQMRFAFSVPTDAQQKLIFLGSSSHPPAPDCVIKANLKSRNQYIYHLPGGQFYDRLNMQLTESRRWFCSEAEAQAAGCRKSKL